MFENMRHLTEEERQTLNDMCRRLQIDELDIDETVFDHLSKINTNETLEKLLQQH